MHSIKESEVRSIVKQLLEDKTLGETMVKVSNVVDPMAAVTNPGNDDYKPDSKAEIQVAFSSLIDEIPQDKLPDAFELVKKALKDEEDQEGKKQMKNQNKKVEEAIRLKIRKILKEAGWADLASAGLAGSIGTNRGSTSMVDCEACEGGGFLPDGAECEICKGKGEVPAKPERSRKNVMMTDVGGASFKDIAADLGFASESGAKQAVDRALEKVKSRIMMDPDEMEIATLTAMNDYIEMLKKTGELSSADVQLLKSHPDIVRELDGFREFLDKALSKAQG